MLPALLCSATTGFPSFLLQAVAARTQIWSYLVTHLPGPSGVMWESPLPAGPKSAARWSGLGDEGRPTRFRVTRWWGQADQVQSQQVVRSGQPGSEPPGDEVRLIRITWVSCLAIPPLRFCFLREDGWWWVPGVGSRDYEHSSGTKLPGFEFSPWLGAVWFGSGHLLRGVSDSSQIWTLSGVWVFALIT